jgi:excisionase family DNA binding protein
MEDDPPVGLRPDQVVAVKLSDDRPEGVIETPTIGHNGGPPVDDSAAGIPIQKLAFSITEAAASAALSRSLIYELIRAGEIKSFRVRGRRRRLIYVDDLRAFLLSERAAANGTDPVCRNPDAVRSGATKIRSSQVKR